MRLALAILGGGALRHALVQDGLQPVEFVAWQVRVAVHDDVAHGLASPRREAACLAVVEREALFQRDAPHPGLNTRHGVAQVRSARQHDVVGVARVPCTEHVSQAIETQVQPKRAQVGQRRRRGCALRQMRVAQSLQL